jgi:hypothetical protein
LIKAPAIMAKIKTIRMIRDAAAADNGVTAADVHPAEVDAVAHQVAHPLEQRGHRHLRARAARELAVECGLLGQPVVGYRDREHSERAVRLLQAAQQAACQSSASSAKLEQYEANIATLREERESLLREKETANALQARLQEELIAIQTAWQDANAKVERLQTSLENVRATVRQECEAQNSTELATAKELLATSEATGTRLKQELLQVRGEGL